MKKDSNYEEQHHDDGYDDYCDDYSDSDYEDNPAPVVMAKKSMALAQANNFGSGAMISSGNTRFSRRLARATEEIVEVNNSRAYVAHVAMDRAAELSMKEDYLSNVAPTGRERYKAIADGYADGVKRLLRGSRK